MRRLLAHSILQVARAAASTFPRSSLVRGLAAGVRNWYESGWPLLSGDRSYIPSQVQDARWDQNYITRREMMRRMRYWYQNSPLLVSIVSVGKRYTVGPAGLHVAFYPVDDSPASASAEGAAPEATDDPWYEQAEQVTKEWFRDCGWNGESMPTLLSVAYGCQKVDGDHFWIKTRKRGALQVNDKTLNVSKPCLLAVEAHRVETPFNRWQDEGRSVIDGVEFQTVTVDGREMMQKVGYWMRNGFGSFETESSWSLIPDAGVIHLFEPHRANQFRGISDFWSCENELGRLEELLKMELQAQQEQSQWAVLVTNATGQFSSLDPKLRAVAAARGQGAPEDKLSEADRLAKMVELYRKTYGASTRAFKQGETADMKAPNRPAEATLQLWEFLVNSVCAGGHAPRCLVFEKISGESAKAQGTEVRATLDSADAYYKGDCEKWRAGVKDAVIYFMEWAVRNDPRVADPPANWRSCIHIPQPQACNVDVGRNTQADIMMLAAGASDYDLLLGPQGLSFNTVSRKLAHQQRKLKQLGVMVTLPALLPAQIEVNGKGTESEPAAKES